MKQLPAITEPRRGASVGSGPAQNTTVGVVKARWQPVRADTPDSEPPNLGSTARALQPPDQLTCAIAELEGELERLRHELAEAHYLAYHDALTGLPNRALLLDRLEQSIARASRQETRIGVLFLDLDDFKGVNDRFGHRAGDQLLQQVASRLSASVRANDTACRYGGDEFVIMLPDLAPGVDLNAVADMIRDRMDTQYLLDGRMVGVTASVGVAEFDVSGEPSGSDLLRQADEAMYRSKRSRATGARPA
jgi:diguanylate cyclase (GGDEF)-like protein